MNRVDATPATDTRQLVTGLYRAIADRTPVTITYTAADGALTLRTIEPMNLTVSSAGEVLVRAMDRLRGEQRSFRIDRIETYTLHPGVPFEQPIEYRIDEPIQDRISGRTGRVLVPGGTRTFILWSDGTEEIIESATIAPLPRHVDAPPSAYFDLGQATERPADIMTATEPTIVQVAVPVVELNETVIEPSHEERAEGAFPVVMIEPTVDGVPVLDWASGGRATRKYHRFDDQARACCDRRIRAAVRERRAREDLFNAFPVCEKCEAL